MSTLYSLFSYEHDFLTSSCKLNPPYLFCFTLKLCQLKKQIKRAIQFLFKFTFKVLSTNETMYLQCLDVKRGVIFPSAGVAHACYHRRTRQSPQILTDGRFRAISTEAFRQFVEQGEILW